MARFLIVNADDFNLTPGVSRGILRAHRDGIVTSTTVLVSLPGLERCRDLAAGVPDLDLGLHMNLTLGRPVLAPARSASLVDRDGVFLRDPDRFTAPGVCPEIRDELCAQVDRFLAVFGRPPTHLDSHHHVHRHPQILAAAVRLARDLGIPLRPACPAQVAALRAQGLVCVDRTIGDIAEAALRDPRRLGALLEALPDGVTELMCHPGYAGAELTVSRYAAPREAELRALCDPGVREAMARAGIRRIGYRSLAGVLEVER